MRRLVFLAAGAVALAGCGGSHTTTVIRTVIQPTAEATPPVPAARGSFDPAAIYKRISPGVVTVISVFPGGSLDQLLGGSGGASEGLGSGFVINSGGEIATNAHVVTTGKAPNLKRATAVYVQFGDGNQVPAKIVGADPNADVALIRVDPAGLTLRPLSFGNSAAAIVGQPVAAIGSPFGEPQSLSVGVISGLNRSIDSLNQFRISNAIQTDAAINHGNSGGPLVDAQGRVLGINSQIESTGGGGEGVGFAVPSVVVKSSVDQLRAKGHVDYAFLGVSSVPVFPQLAKKIGLPVNHGALLRQVNAGQPAAKAGLRGGTKDITFQGVSYRIDGDVIVAVDGRPLDAESDLSDAIAGKQPGDVVTIQIYRGSKKLSVKVKLGARPDSSVGG